MFALEKFDHFVYGRQVLVHSDHKPLQMIAAKPLLSAPKRLQRMLMKLQRYDYIIEYHPGKEMHIADTLSRAYGTMTCPRPASSSQTEQIAVVDQSFSIELEATSATSDLALRIPRSQLAAIKKATSEDTVLQAVAEVIKKGWPDDRSGIEPAILPYYHIRDELTVDDNILFKGQRWIVPLALRREMLKTIHNAHSGIEGCLRRARECIFWPGMSTQVKDFISRCDVCQSRSRSQPKESMVPSTVPDGPWLRVGADLFSFAGQDYVIAVDYFSNYWETERLESTMSASVIQKLKQTFSRYGIPEVLRTDNGTQFSAKEFRDFAREWKFEHLTSSPHFAQSNGKVENAVEQAKHLMERARLAGTDPWLGLLTLRNTPTTGMDTSPVQRLMGRRTRTTIPMTRKLLEPATDNQIAEEQMQRNKERQKMYYDRGARDLPALQPGETIRMDPLTKGGHWRKGQVVQVEGNRSYTIETEGGRRYRRNRRQLRSSKEAFYEQPERLPVFPEDGQEKTMEENTETRQTAETQPEMRTTVTRSGRIVRPPRWLQDYHI